ncbi:MAG: hypothetical protein ACRD2J_15005 [Thermoanaerobaculia bacterium]
MRVAALVSILALVACEGIAAGRPNMEKIYAEIEKQTGLVRTDVPGAEGEYLGKTHRGYRVLYTAKAGNVWGRYAARLTMGEVGREVGGVLGYLTGQRPGGVGTIVGSPLDRLLSDIIGQPLVVTVLLDHGKPGAPRLDIVSRSFPLPHEEAMAQQAKISMKAGVIYSDDATFAASIAENDALMKRLRKLRGEMIRVDEEVVAFLWAGSETDYSGMIRDHGGYYPMVNAILDDLADIADAVPADDSPAR